MSDTPSKLGIMTDLETLALGPKCVITQVGIIGFPLDDPETEMRRINEYLLVQPQLALERTIDFSTVSWWLQQDEKARARFSENEGNDMEEFLASVRSIHRKLSDLIRSVGERNVEMWARGPQFDLVALGTLFLDCGLDVPWPYDSVMDLRTLGRLAGVSSSTIDRAGLVPHVAIEDCRFQIRHYAEAMRQLRAAH